jgi:hypothetical protein
MVPKYAQAKKCHTIFVAHKGILGFTRLLALTW